MILSHIPQYTTFGTDIRTFLIQGGVLWDMCITELVVRCGICEIDLYTILLPSEWYGIESGINNKTSLVQITTWCLTCDEPLSEATMAQFVEVMYESCDEIFGYWRCTLMHRYAVQPQKNANSSDSLSKMWTIFVE